MNIAFKQNKFDGVVSDWARLLKKKLNKVKNVIVADYGHGLLTKKLIKS